MFKISILIVHRISVLLMQIRSYQSTFVKCLMRRNIHQLFTRHEIYDRIEITLNPATPQLQNFQKYKQFFPKEIKIDRQTKGQKRQRQKFSSSVCPQKMNMLIFLFIESSALELVGTFTPPFQIILRILIIRINIQISK